MITKRLVKDVKVSILREADKSDPLNNSLAVGFTAMVDGEEVFARSIILRSSDFKNDIEKLVASVIAKALSGKEIYSKRENEQVYRVDNMLEELLHYVHKEDAL